VLWNATSQLSMRHWGTVCADRVIAEALSFHDSQRGDWLQLLSQITGSLPPLAAARVLQLAKDSIASDDGYTRFAAMLLLQAMNTPASWQTLQDGCAADPDLEQKRSYEGMLSRHAKAITATKVP
jgi:hypothetical protein